MGRHFTVIMQFGAACKLGNDSLALLMPPKYPCNPAHAACHNSQPEFATVPDRKPLEACPISEQNCCEKVCIILNGKFANLWFYRIGCLSAAVLAGDITAAEAFPKPWMCGMEIWIDTGIPLGFPREYCLRQAVAARLDADFFDFYCSIAAFAFLLLIWKLPVKNRGSLPSQSTVTAFAPIKHLRISKKSLARWAWRLARNKYSNHFQVMKCRVYHWTKQVFKHDMETRSRFW